MAGKGRQSWEKRQREKAKREKQEAKRADRAERRSADPEEIDDEAPSEAELYERFARLSEAYADGRVDEETFEEKKAELFEMLGLELH